MILSINIGTSSIKAAVFSNDLTEQARVGISPTGDIQTSVLQVISECLEKIQGNVSQLSAFGVRIVHGGEQYQKPTPITKEVLATLRTLEPLAPLHNPLAVRVIKVLLEHYPQIPVVGVFDTSFHSTMPNVASHYAIPPSWQETHHVKRYGFHGLAHASMLKAYGQHTQTPSESATIITLQLGSGCSMCAIKNGTSIDTSMGFSPLEGLVSRTRSGDIDASVIRYLSSQQGITHDAMLELLNTESGLKGLSGTEGGMDEILLGVQANNPSSVFALELFIYRIQKYLGAYDAVLGGAQAIIVGGGISEHCPEVIQRIFANPFFGVTIDPSITFEKSEALITVSHQSSRRPVFLCFVNEEKEIAEATSLVTHIPH